MYMLFRILRWVLVPPGEIIVSEHSITLFDKGVALPFVFGVIVDFYKEFLANTDSKAKLGYPEVA